MATPELHALFSANHKNAMRLAQAGGVEHVQRILKKAQKDLERRLRDAEGLGGTGKSSFTAVQLRVALAQVRQVSRGVAKGIKTTLLDNGRVSAEQASANVIDYLEKANKKFKGVGEQPLALKEAAIVDTVTEGVNSTILRRLASSGENWEGAEEEPSPAKVGILERYGLETVSHFEDILQTSLLTRKPWGDVRDEITQASPFLQQAPAFWAERIVRTESMAIQNRAGWETIREVDDELGDMCKIIAGVFDERTGADSFATHGQIRRPEEAFESWFGLYQHPPDRPNDRSVVVPHRISWPIPEYLSWKSNEQIATRWKAEGRKGKMPPRPKMTTIPLSQFGVTQKKAEK